MSEHIQYGIPFLDYETDPGLNASALKAGRKSMLHMRHYMAHGIKQTAAMTKGLNIHSAILEPDRFFESLVIWDRVRRGKDWDMFQAEHQDSIILQQAELQELQAISNSVHANQEAHKVIEATKHEASIFWDHEKDGPGKARLDGYNEDTGYVAEVKSTHAIDPWLFSKTCYNMGTHIQLGWQKIGLDLIGAKCVQFVIIAVEQSPPHDCIAYYPDQQFIEAGMEEALLIAGKWRAALASGIWYGIGGADRTVPLSLPSWAGGGVELKIAGENVKL